GGGGGVWGGVERRRNRFFDGGGIGADAQSAGESLDEIAGFDRLGAAEELLDHRLLFGRLALAGKTPQRGVHLDDRERFAGSSLQQKRDRLAQVTARSRGRADRPQIPV